MLVVETIANICRKHTGEGKSIRSTARELGISRNTVRKVVRDGKAEHRYDRSDKQPRPKLDGFTQLLETELENNAKRTRRDRLTLREIWRRLCDRGCEAGYDAVRRYARKWIVIPTLFWRGCRWVSSATRPNWPAGTSQEAPKR